MAAHVKTRGLTVVPSTVQAMPSYVAPPVAMPAVVRTQALAVAMPAAVATLPPAVTYGGAPVTYGGAPVAPATLPAALPAPLPVAPMASPSTQEPQAPAKLTNGIPDPAAIDSQKAAYSRSIDDQLAEGLRGLQQQNQAQKDMIGQACHQQEAQYALQIEQQTQGQLLALEQQAAHQHMQLQQAAYQRKTQLEQQAAALTMEYQQKKAQEEYNFQHYEVHKTYYEQQMKLQEEAMRVQGPPQQSPPPMAVAQLSYVAPPTYAAPVAPATFAAPVAPMTYAAPGVATFSVPATTYAQLR